MTPDEHWITGVLVGAVAVPVLALLFRLLHVEVEEGYALVVTRFGRHVATITQPGLHWLVDGVMPWVQTKRVSLRRDFRQIDGIRVNDARGTTIVVDVWLELRIERAERTLFAVADWESSLKNLVSHSVIASLASREFEEILRNRSELGELIRKDLAEETERWGIVIDELYVKDISLLPEVARQMNQALAARLERATADIIEEGRQRVAMLDAETSARIATLLAEAKTQYASAMGRAYAKLAGSPDVRAAYDELYRLSVLQPHRTVAFWGFDKGSLSATDAAMLIADAPAGSPVRGVPAAEE